MRGAVKGLLGMLRQPVFWVWTIFYTIVYDIVGVVAPQFPRILLTPIFIASFVLALVLRDVERNLRSHFRRPQD